jgi:hypothetical protein
MKTEQIAAEFLKLKNIGIEKYQLIVKSKREENNKVS